jgi:hypothetical protein
MPIKKKKKKGQVRSGQVRSGKVRSRRLGRGTKHDGRDHETKRRGITPERLTTNHPLK